MDEPKVSGHMMPDIPTRSPALEAESREAYWPGLYKPVVPCPKCAAARRARERRRLDWQCLVLPGDLVLTSAAGLLARAIRSFTRSPGEAPSLAHHAGLISTGGLLREATIVEAHARTRHGGLCQFYGGTGTRVSIWRLKWIGDDTRRTIARIAMRYVGRRYPWWRFVAHLADWYLGGRYIVRRMFFSKDYPMCHWLAAHATWRAVGYLFGGVPDARDPDDLLDWVTAHPEDWDCVRPLSPIEREP